VDEVEVALIGFRGNTALNLIPAHLKPLRKSPEDTVLTAWNHALNGVPQMKHWTVEEIMRSADNCAGVDSEWREYIRQRYGV
jgi:hypothetical protein